MAAMAVDATTEGATWKGRVSGAMSSEYARCCVDALSRVVDNLLNRLQVLVFELQDGVALQNMCATPQSAP